MTDTPRLCKATRRSGEQCPHLTVGGSDYCGMHNAPGLVTVSVPVEMEDDIRRYIAHVYAARTLGESAAMERYESLSRRMSALLDPDKVAAKVQAAAEAGIREGSRGGRADGLGQRLPQELLLDIATTAAAQSAFLTALHGGPMAERAAAEVESQRKALSRMGVDSQRIATAVIAGYARAVEVMRILDSKVKPEDTDE